MIVILILVKQFSIWKYSTEFKSLPLSFLLLSIPTADMNNVLIFGLLVPKPSTSLEKPESLFGCTRSELLFCLSQDFASEFHDELMHTSVA